MLARWPGVTEPASVCDEPVMIEDFFSTLLEIAGADGLLEDVATIDGRSFVPLLRGGADPERSARPLVWHLPNNWGPTGPGLGPSSSIRLGDWKLVYYHTDRSYELFNLVEDLGEQRNLADAEPETRDRLAARLSERLAEVEAQMPIVRATGESVPFPGLR